MVCAHTTHTYATLLGALHNTHTPRSSDRFSYDFFSILGTGSSCSCILANLSSLMWEIKYMINCNLPELLRACVVCGKEKVVSSVLVAGCGR